MYHMFYFKARFRVNICGCCSENRLESNTFETNTERVRTTRTRSELLIPNAFGKYVPNAFFSCSSRPGIYLNNRTNIYSFQFDGDINKKP